MVYYADTWDAMKIFKYFKNRIQSVGMHSGDWVALVIASFIAASTVYAIEWDFTSLLYVRMYSVGTFFLSMGIAFLLLFGALLILRRVAVVKVSLYALSLLFAVVLAIEHSGDIFFNLGLAFVLFFIVRYCMSGVDTRTKMADVSERFSFIAVAVLFVIYVAFVYVCTSAKYKSFSHGSFDFGIFAQMFEQMAKTGLPMTTVERSEYLSHFAVHFSPIFYTVLPGYFVFRSPLYLLFIQAVVTGLGAFPIRRICRELKFSNTVSTLLAFAYLFFPTLANGTFYDFHENKFLGVLILYFVLFVLKGKRIPAAVFALLTLSVKEDAFIYVLSVALFMLFTKRDRIFALALAAFSLAYFFFACEMIKVCGGEIMSSRFENLTCEPDKGLISVIKTCFIDVGYLIKDVFSGADTEKFNEFTYSGQKLEFVLWCAVPLCGLPLLQKKAQNLFLLLPLLVINLMPYWLYQSSINFQYTYGTVALMFFAALLTLYGANENRAKFFAVLILTLCIVFSVSSTSGKARNNLANYYENIDDCKKTEEVLSKIPRDASVTAYGYMMPHMPYIDDMHTCPEYYADYALTDYYVIDKRFKGDNHTAKMISAMNDNYVCVDEGGYAEVYKRID